MMQTSSSIASSEINHIGPIPPPRMFSDSHYNHQANHTSNHQTEDYAPPQRDHSSYLYHGNNTENGYNDEDSDEDSSSYNPAKYMPTTIPVCIVKGTPSLAEAARIEEIPAKEPKFSAVPLKSALKKKSDSPQQHGTQVNSSPSSSLAIHHHRSSSGISNASGGSSDSSPRPYHSQSHLSSHSPQSNSLQMHSQQQQPRFSYTSPQQPIQIFPVSSSSSSSSPHQVQTITFSNNASTRSSRYVPG